MVPSGRVSAGGRVSKDGRKLIAGARGQLLVHPIFSYMQSLATISPPLSLAFPMQGRVDQESTNCLSKIRAGDGGRVSRQADELVPEDKDSTR